MLTIGCEINSAYVSVLTGERIQIDRHHTLTDGYVFLIREYEGIIGLIQGISNVISGAVAPVTNEKCGLIGRAQLKDAAINLCFSPIILLGVGILIGKNL